MTDSLTQAGMTLTFGDPTQRILSGYEGIDKVTGGFRKGNCYICGGAEKTGKSSLVMKMVGTMLEANLNVTYINTELSNLDFYNRMTAINTGTPIKEVEKNTDEHPVKQTLLFEWVRDNAENLKHYGIQGKDEEDITEENGQLSFKKVMNLLEAEAENKCDVVIIDNVTSFKTNSARGEAQWETLSKVLTQLINFTKQKNILAIIVMHTKGGQIYKETPEGIRTILKSDNPESIFDETISIVKKPCLDDIYGGAGVLSQLSGAILVWRPFQKVKEGRFQKLSSLILESFRHSANAELRTVFDGERITFEEFEPLEVSVNKYLL
jgi:archaellum biogenesis ATPase FlaH